MSTEKGLYPYDYMDSFEHLLDKKHFYSLLYEIGFADEDCATANLLWMHFIINNLGDDQNGLHLITGLLTDALENFRDMFELLWSRSSIFIFGMPSYTRSVSNLGKSVSKNCMR